MEGGGRPCVVDDCQAQQTFKHAAVFGVQGPYSRANAERCKAAIIRFVENPATIAVRGTYNRGAGGGMPAAFYYEPRRRRVVVTTIAGEFVTGFRMDVQQTAECERTGRLGGGS